MWCAGFFKWVTWPLTGYLTRQPIHSEGPNSILFNGVMFTIKLWQKVNLMAPFMYSFTKCSWFHRITLIVSARIFDEIPLQHLHLPRISVVCLPTLCQVFYYKHFFAIVLDVYYYRVVVHNVCDRACQ